jgi:hypothetical protein
MRYRVTKKIVIEQEWVVEANSKLHARNTAASLPQQKQTIIKEGPYYTTMAGKYGPAVKSLYPLLRR